MRRSRKLIGPLAAATIIMLVLACGVLALVLHAGHAPVAMATQQEVEQQAVQFAQRDYGTVTSVAARATSQGEVNPQHCSLTERVRLQIIIYQGNTAWNWCDNHLPMWSIMLQGEFRNHDGALFRTLHIVAMPDGNTSMITEGPVEER